MKKILTIVILILFCFSLTSCSVIEALKYSVSGNIIDPVDDFLAENQAHLYTKIISIFWFKNLWEIVKST